MVKNQRLLAIGFVFLEPYFLCCLGLGSNPVGSGEKGHAAVQPTSGLTPKTARSSDRGTDERMPVTDRIQKLPVRFEANQGQAGGEVRFVARTSRYNLFLTGVGMAFALNPVASESRARGGSVSPLAPAGRLGIGAASSLTQTSRPDLLRIRFAGASPEARVVGLDQLAARSNYLIGSDPSNWRTNIPNFARVRYEGLYPGTAVTFYANSQELEYDIVITPGAEPHRIALRFEGSFQNHAVAPPHVDANGDLVFRTDGAEVRLRRPVAYQSMGAMDTPDSKRRPVGIHYALRTDGSVGFKLGHYDSARPLIIDPVLTYSTYLGGTGAEQAGAIAVDASGNAYVTGSTQSLDFPTSAPFQATNGGLTNVFVAKIGAGGSGLVYSTYLGGSANDQGLGIALDAAGNVYVVGQAQSVNYPTTAGAFQTACRVDESGNCADAFLSKLSADGSALLYSTYLGGSASDTATSVAVDSAGNVYLAGQTQSSDYPATAGAFQTACGGTGSGGSCADAFMTKLSPAGLGPHDLVYSTFLGGSGNDSASAIAIDGASNIYVAGQSQSLDFPTTSGAFQATCRTNALGNCADAFMVKLTLAGGGASDLVYGTYLGGSGPDQANRLAVDDSSNVYLTGNTQSSDFPSTSGSWQTACKLDGLGNCADAFIAKLNPAAFGAASLVYATFLGGSGSDQSNGAAVDAAGNIFVTGATTSVDFPLANALQATPGGGMDAFVTKLNATGSAIIFSSYLGGSGNDQGVSIALDGTGNAYLTGSTLSGNFPTSNPLQSSCSSCATGSADVFVAELSSLQLSVASLAPATLSFGSVNVGTSSSASTATLTNLGDAPLSLSGVATTGDFSQTNNCGSSVAPAASCTLNLTFSPRAGGTRTGTLVVTDNAQGSPHTINLTGTGISGAWVQLSSAALGFGNQLVGTTSTPQTLTLTNTGNLTLAISKLSFTPTGQVSFGQTNTCGGTVAAGASCSVTVTFTPAATGAKTAALSVTDNAPGSPQTVNLTGTGVAPVVTLGATKLTFNTQVVGTTSAAKTVTLTNTGAGTLIISSLTASGDYAQTNTCGSSVSPGGSCTISVTFSPAASGTRSGSVTITDNSATKSQVITLTGTGTAVAVAPSSLKFGAQTVNTGSQPQTVTLTNAGATAVALNSITASGDFAPANNCGSSLGAGSSCTVSVTFTPTAAGARTGSLTISDSDPSSPQIVTLTGTGVVAPSYTLSTSSLSFPALVVGTKSPAQSVVLSNTGSVSIAFSGITATGDFAPPNNCGSSLGPGGSCAINVTFTPTAAGTRAGSLSINDNAGSGTQTVSLAGVGTFVEITPPALSFPAIRLVGTTSGALTATLTNTGGAVVAVTSIVANGDFTQSNNCGSLASGASCTIGVAFTPTASGSRIGAISVNSSDPGSPETLSLSGVGTFLQFAPSSVVFGSQNVGTTSTARTVSVTNTGSAPLTFLSIVSSGDFAQTNTCGSTLAAGSGCSASVTFAPTGAGLRNGSLTFNDSDGSALQTVSLSGTGQVPNSTVTISPRAASLVLSQSRQFTSNTSVTWSVDGVVGGNPAAGTITSSGEYTAPGTVGSHLVTATSLADSTQSASALVYITNYAGTFTYHNDGARTGQNLQESALSTGNVNSSQFGKLFSYAVDGQVYAQPLYVPNVNIPNQGAHNVAYVATENDSVYALDADGLASAPLWQTSFINPSAGITTVPASFVNSDSVQPQIGITSTPVIDPSSGTLYVVPYTKEGGGCVYRLHALDITNGAEKFGGPVLIQASVPGTGAGTDGHGNVAFNCFYQGQRPGLLLLNGTVYVAFASGHDDTPPFHGWLLGYNAQTLQQVAVFNTTPNGGDGGIWSSGGAPAVDSNGNLFFMSGNGTFDANTGGVDVGDSVVKLSVSGGGLSLADYFTPFDQAYLSAKDVDLGSGGVMLLPDQPGPYPHVLIGGGKEGKLYLVNRDNMGQYQAGSDSQIVQSLLGGAGGVWCTPAYWQNNLYLVPVNDTVRAFQVNNGLLSIAPVAKGSVAFAFPGATPSVSANGSTEGIVWVIQRTTAGSQAAVLHAYDAANVSRELYSSNQAGTRDLLDVGVKFAVPTVANGKVYVGTSSTLTVFGLMP